MSDALERLLGKVAGRFRKLATHKTAGHDAHAARSEYWQRLHDSVDPDDEKAGDFEKHSLYHKAEADRHSQEAEECSGLADDMDELGEVFKAAGTLVDAQIQAMTTGQPYTHEKTSKAVGVTLNRTAMVRDGVQVFPKLVPRRGQPVRQEGPEVPLEFEKLFAIEDE